LGVQRRAANIDVARVQDVGLRTADDPAVLQWAADEGRVLMTHDIKTIPDFAHERVSAGLPMPGVLIVRSVLPIAVVIDELVIIEAASDPDDLEGWRPLPPAVLTTAVLSRAPAAGASARVRQRLTWSACGSECRYFCVADVHSRLLLRPKGVEP